MNSQTVIERDLASGRKVRVTIDDNGFVLVQGATKVNVIYDFYFSVLGHGFAPPAHGESYPDRIVVHTEQSHDGVTAELSMDINRKPAWWTPSERPAVRLLPSGALRSSSAHPRFQVQFRQPDQAQFKDAGRVLLMEKSEAA